MHIRCEHPCFHLPLVTAAGGGGGSDKARAAANNGGIRKQLQCRELGMGVWGPNGGGGGVAGERGGWEEGG